MRKQKRNRLTIRTQQIKEKKRKKKQRAVHAPATLHEELGSWKDMQSSSTHFQNGSHTHT